MTPDRRISTAQRELVEPYKRRIVNLYRINTGIAAIQDGFWLFEVSTGITGYRAEQWKDLTSFIRTNYESMHDVAWLKRLWRQRLVKLKAQLRDALKPISNVPFRAMVRELAKRGWGESWGQLRANLWRAGRSFLTRAQAITIRNILWKIRAVQIRLCGESLELFDLDIPLRTIH